MLGVLVTIAVAFSQSIPSQSVSPESGAKQPAAAVSPDELYRRAAALVPGAEAQKSLDALKEALVAGADAVRALSDPVFLPLHENPEFRNLIRRFTTSSETTIVTPGEPGTPLRVRGKVTDEDGKPVAGARIYVFQTGASGSYSTAGGNAADSGDSLNPRIFGYMVSAVDGSYAFSTIRYEVHVAGYEAAVTEFMFEGDPRLTADAREWVTRAGFGICKPTVDANNVQQCTFDIKLTSRS